MSAETENSVGLRISFEAMLGQVAKTMSDVTKGLDRIHEFLAANPVRTPISRPIMGSTVAAASALTYTFLDLGGPPSGWYREVRWFTCWGPDPTATLTGVSVFVFQAGPGQYPDSSTEPPGFTELTEISTSTVPNKFTASSNELTIPHGRHLLLCFKSLGNSQQVNAYGQAWDYRESTRMSEPI